MKYVTDHLNRIFVTLIVTGCLAIPALGQEYKEYRKETNRELMFELMFNEKRFGYAVERDSITDRFVFDRSEIRVHGDEVKANAQLLLDSDGLHVWKTIYRFSEISDIRISKNRHFTVISFYTRPEESRRASRLRRGNLIEPSKTVVVEDEEFIRGVVFSVTGDIEIYGEVSKNVISLFGDVFVGPDAVVRGDVVSVTGRIDLARDASVYGDILSGTDSRLGRRHRFRRFQSAFEDMFDIDLDGTSSLYNRVDGLSLGLTLEFSDPDSVLPTVWAGGSYAFESKRWRYHLGLEQTVLRRPALTIGGSAFRRLASEDDWLLSSGENSAFAALFREDYKDYYETEGAAAYIRLRPIRNLLVESGVRYEETRWLDAERDLWSLFGGDHKFAPNFGSVDSVARTAGIEDIDTGTNYTLYGSFDYDTRDENDPYYYSGWAAKGVFELSNPDLDSDYDYTHYRLSLIRHQKLNRRIIAIIRGVYGGSDGSLPMHKRFYLGGLGTLYGYDHKEFSGNHFWLANIEYRIDFPHSDLAASLRWDVGQISEGSDFGETEVRHSLGVALYIGNAFKIGLAKRLDRSYDDKPELFARFAYSL